VPGIAGRARRPPVPTAAAHGRSEHCGTAGTGGQPAAGAWPGQRLPRPHPGPAPTGSAAIFRTPAANGGRPVA